MLVSSRNLMVLKFFSEFNTKFEVTFGKKCIAW